MKKLIKNICYLSMVKGVDFLIPLMLIPFVLKHIGFEQYGIFSLSLILFNFGISLIDFGHSLTAIKEIAGKDSNDEESIINQVISFRFLFSILVSSLWFISSLFFDEVSSLIVAIFSIALIIESLSLSFYFHAKQEMKIVSLVQLLSRIVSTCLVFVLINNENDLAIYSALHVLPNIINVIVIFIMFFRIKSENYKFKFDINLIRIKKGWDIYSYQMLSGLILPITSSFIASVYGIKSVALFSVCQRVVSSIYRLFEPTMFSIYPYLSKFFKSNYDTFKSKSVLFLFLFFIASLSFSIILNVFGTEIQIYISGEVFTNDGNALYTLMSFLIIPMVMNLITTRLLIIIEKEKIIAKVLAISFVLICLSLIAVYLYGFSLPYVSVSLLIGYFFTMFVTIGLYIRNLK
ncbi:MAG: oligosaccharide flippase family protein [Moritella sp.]|uniref:oligosaccharide flippase family protein n=1 Tax=Moritella sp. TaxID=78556 RepID=UPI0025CB87F1|nr:oligosaccharide flippase family protein [Moritella sp.]NQZ94143.1 oligosaccharide flippase family protein [Moritella sp.]